MAEEMPKHALECYDTLEGREKILNVVIDLPIDASSPGFDADALDALWRQLAKRRRDGGYAGVAVHSKLISRRA